MLYATYIESANDGRCLAHALDLPGCIAPGATCEEALQRLPKAIRDHCAWLRGHGEPAPPVGIPIEITVAERHTGTGPFDPGDAAALFAPDREPLSTDGMEGYLHLLAHSRADLLALVEGLAYEVLDWSPVHAPGTFTVRRILRHVGDAEEWYVSRLVPPETLPPEWDDDEELPALVYLEMERCTALDRLRALGDRERSSVHYPTSWTDHPDEAWTARKALRRALEHELQHTAQVRRILGAHRRYQLAGLAVERAELLAQILYLDEGVLTGEVVHGGWTVRDTLAHIAAWDAWEHLAMRCMVGGGEPDLSALDGFGTSNAAFLAERRTLSLREVLAELRSARAAWTARLEELPLSEFYRARSYGGDDWTFPTLRVAVQGRHDAHHAGRIAAWRGAREGVRTSGDKDALLAALDAAREELLSAAALVPPDARASRLVCGTWTLVDVVGHLADWEALGAAGLRQMAAGQAPFVEHIADIQTWNEAHAAARSAQPWEQVWDDLQDARRDLVGALEGMSQDDLERLYPFPWGVEGTPYQWVAVYVDHDRTHARGIRSDRARQREEDGGNGGKGSL